MGPPCVGAVELHVAGDAPHHGGVPASSRQRRPKGIHLVSVHAGQLSSDIHHRPPIGEEQVSGAQPNVAVGALAAGAPWRAGQHHRLCSGGHQALATPPANIHRTGNSSIM